MDHRDIEKFQRLSKACLYAASRAILCNIEDFQKEIDQDLSENDEYLKNNLPTNIIELSNYEVKLEADQFKIFQA